MGHKKLAAFLILLVCFQRSETVFSQNLPHLTLSEKNAPLEKVLDDIQQLTGYTHFTNTVRIQLQQAKNISFTVRNAPLQEVLDLCFKDQPFTYEIVGTAIDIKLKAPPRLISGRVINDKNEPVPGASIQLKGLNGTKEVKAVAFSDDHGDFEFILTDPEARLLVSCVNYESQEIGLPGGKATQGPIVIALKAKVGELQDVVVSNGYQDILKDRATGSFNKIDNELINRRVSTGILDRLDGVTSSLIFNKNITQGANQSAITIRGRSTIFASPDPLVIIDNFPYNGDINNINPDDVESITVLKDAAAASIWGAFSGNGVIVIATKKGKYNQAPKLTFNTSLNAGLKPDLNYLPIMSSGDYIDVEQYLYGNQFYAGQLVSPLHPALSPVVEILAKKDKGQISAEEAQAQIGALRGLDTRRDLKKYFYQGSWNQKYSLSMTGGGSRNRYFLSAGLDKNTNNLVRDGYNRVTVNGNGTYNLIPKKLELNTALAFTYSRTFNNQPNNNTIFGAVIPYLQLVGPGGVAQPIPYILREAYVDTVGAGKLLDWHYRPLDELRNANSTISLQDYRFNAGLRYVIWKGLDIQANYQYGHGYSEMKNVQSIQTYAARSLINNYTQIDPSGKLIYPIPLGGILDQYSITYNSNNVRLQLDYDRHLGEDHQLTAIVGAELRDIEGVNTTTRLYGYDPDHPSGVQVNYTTQFPIYSVPGSKLLIPFLNHTAGTSDRFISYFLNASYTYKNRYILSASSRRDESNLFGVNANQKGVPLWSVGGAWDISKEGFYAMDWLPHLKLRVTHGYNGNVDRSVSAYTTATLNQGGNPYGTPSSTIINPPNPNLRWEKIGIFNTGLDFGSRGDKLEGSLEYFIKEGHELIGNSPVDPTTGFIQYIGNTADMIAHGLDLVLRTKYKLGKVQWNGSFLFSYIRDRVTQYHAPASIINSYFNTAEINPLPGHPLYSVYALRWQGLDPLNGDPQGWLDGHISKNWTAIENSTNTQDLLYKGPATPPFFGSFRNAFGWRQWSLSFNIVYKFGYYFRRSSINYFHLFSGNYPGHADYERRWQKTGDELHTSVPSMTYPANNDRDFFYANSEVLVTKGDHIRLQDIQCSYDLIKQNHRKLPVQAIRFYLYANNIGILWRANHQGIDPDNISTLPNPRSLALGMKVDL